jgi:hypothetical protein
MEPQGGEAEGGAPTLRRVWPGHVLATAIGLATVAVFSLGIYQFEFWQHYFFRDAVNVGEACGVAVRRGASSMPIDALRALPRTPVVLPHARGLFGDLTAKDETGERLTAYYHCDVRVQDFGREEGVVNLHTGWIVGETVEILVNGQARASFHQLAKPAVVLTLADLTKPTVALEVVVQGPANTPAGFIGLTPVVAARGAAVNARIFAVDFALTNQKKLYTILPLLTLGLVLVFGWWIGFRTRTMTVTMFYLCLSAARNVVPMLADFWPWNLQQTNWLTEIALHAAVFAYVLFAMETMGLWSKAVPRLMVGVAGTAGVAVVLTLATKPSPETVHTGRFVALCIESILMIATMLYGWRSVILMPREGKTDVAAKRASHITVYLTGFVLFATWLDYALIKWSTSQLRLSPQVEKILPLFVGGI